MAPRLLLLLLWLQACVADGSASPDYPGPPALRAYKRVRLHEGETLSVQCSYQSRQNQVEGKVWCKINKRKCETRFPRHWVKGPRYRMQDDVQAKVITVTMVNLKQQDAGRYWCMRNTSRALYPLEGFLLEVSPGAVTQRTARLTHLADKDLKSRPVFTTGPAPTSGPDAPFTSGVAPFTPGPLIWASLRPSATLGTPRPTSVTGSSLTGIATTVGPRRTMGLQPVTLTPRDTSSPVSISTKPSSSVPTSRRCRDQLPSTRLREPHLTALVVLLALLPVPVMLAVVYRFWKKKHRGSYSLGSDSARPWRPPARRPEALLKPAWFETS
ncbi:trem-like transcript 2 protein [Fukomys damarensis]|uniref:Trem-like transcript 2 protein n=1 Tax=Fukomys damarensis TaxID=885580 RepID=A0A091DJF8_FUKDA|nr:trem-like transcript 2 protein [Fukomys damarensis]KFO30420.1 Trem-like transcript 2 protein [Fukomys damarensis]